jgi:hypothetical protein
MHDPSKTASLHSFGWGWCACRGSFQLPEAHPSLAELITTSRHQRWIESFLAQSSVA